LGHFVGVKDISTGIGTLIIPADIIVLQAAVATVIHIATPKVLCDKTRGWLQ